MSNTEKCSCGFVSKEEFNTLLDHLGLEMAWSVTRGRYICVKKEVHE